MKTILVPTDFSEQANNALDFACEVARKIDDSEVRVLHIIESPNSGTFNTMGDIGYADSEEQRFMALYIRKSQNDMVELVGQEKYNDVNISTDVQVGNAFKSISKAITDIAADLVVMGTQGISGVDEILIGSNTEKVVRYAKCPVITIKEPADLDDIKHIVFATNLTEEQGRIVEELKKLQEMTGAELKLVKVNTPNHFFTNRQLQKDFEKFKEKYHLTNCSTHIYNDATEEDGILYFAEEIGSCMIAMATHGRTGILHLLSGSIAEDLVNHAKMPVWTLSMKK